MYKFKNNNKSHRINTKRSIPRHIIAELLKAAREKELSMYKGITLD